MLFTLLTVSRQALLAVCPRRWLLLLLLAAHLAPAQPAPKNAEQQRRALDVRRKKMKRDLATGPQRDARAMDSLHRMLALHPADTLGASALVSLMYYAMYTDTATGGRYGRRALRLADSLNDHKQVARACYNLATMAGQAGELDKSVALHLRSARAYLAEGNELWAGHNYANASRRRQAQGRYIEAMRLSLRGLRLRQAAHDTAAVADSYGNMGQIYLEQRNLPAAQHAYERSLRGWQQARVPLYIINSLDHLAIIHREAGRYDSARAYVARGLAAVRTQSDSTQEAGLLLTLAVLEQRQGRWAASLPLLRRTEAHLKRRTPGTVTPSELADLYSILGESLIQTGQAAAAAPYLTKALALARAGDDPHEIADALEGLADLAAARGDYRGAFERRRELELIRDTLRQAATTRTVAELQTQYETREKEARNRLQTARLHTQQQIIGRRNVLLWSGLVVALLLAGVAYLWQSRRRARREAEFAHERQQLERLRATAVLEAEEAERRRIGADLHDGVGQLLTAAKLNLHALEAQLAAGPYPRTLLQNALDTVDESFREVRGISHNLMPNALIRRGLALAVRDFLDKLPPDGRLKINLEVVGLDRPGTLDHTVENVLFRVIQELVQNIVKHARASTLTLQLVRRPTELAVLVADDGAGFDLAALEPEAGIGLRNIESRVAYLGGWVEFDSRPGHGTSVTLEIPLPEPQH